MASTMPSDMSADVVVVGAGPGGSSTAYHLARAGLDVILLEKSPFPRDTLTQFDTMTRVETTSVDAEHPLVRRKTRATHLGTRPLKGSTHGLRRTDSYPQTTHLDCRRVGSRPYPHNYGYRLRVTPAQRR